MKLSYHHLRNLLIKRRFADADELTSQVMLWVANREREGWLRKEDIENYPTQELCTIDKLWLAASNGKFGFSVQKKIWIDINGKSKYSKEAFDLFTKSLGWDETNTIIFELRAKQGYLPLGLYVKTSDNARLHQKWCTTINLYKTIYKQNSLVQRDNKCYKHMPKDRPVNNSKILYDYNIIACSLVIILSVLIFDNGLFKYFLLTTFSLALILIFNKKNYYIISLIISGFKVLLRFYSTYLKPHPYFSLLSRKDLLD